MTACNQTVALALKSTAEHLQAISDSADFEAAELLAHVLGTTQNRLLFYRTQVLTTAQQSRLQQFLSRRLNGEPLQYLLGSWEFYGLTFAVGPGVLIPRPDTEILVEQLLEKACLKEKPVIADLCAGSGAIAVSTALNLPGSTVFAVEKSPEAFTYLTQNIKQNRAPVKPLLANALNWAPPENIKLDFLVSNPPYIPSNDLKTLSAEVQKEPAMALDGGTDGLDFYRIFTQNGCEILAPGGWILFEVGIHQAQAVKALLQNAGYKDIFVQKDFAGIDRVVGGRL